MTLPLLPPKLNQLIWLYSIEGNAHPKQQSISPQNAGRSMFEPIITFRGTVYPWQCDHMGHMNIMWHASRFDEASWQLLSVLGMTTTRLRETRTGIAAVEQHVRYLRELHAGDPITVRSSLIDIGEKTLRLRHEMTNDEQDRRVATSTIIAVHFDCTIRKARCIPPDIREKALRMLSAPRENPRAEQRLQCDDVEIPG